MKKGFPRATLAIVTSLLVCCVFFGVVMAKEGDRSALTGFVLVPALAAARLVLVDWSPQTSATLFWGGAALIAFLSASKKQIVFPITLVLYSAVALVAAWTQAALLWKS